MGNQGQARVYGPIDQFREDKYQNFDSNTNTVGNSVGNYFYNSSSNTNFQPELFFQYIA